MKILNVRGTEIHAVPSFLILMVLFVIFSLESGRPWHEAVLWVPIIFISVLFHEGGHAAAYGALGLGPSQIVLGGFGGFTINRSQRKVWQDVLVSLAGPLFSFLLAGLVFPLDNLAFFKTDPMFAALLPYLIWANVVWGIFNLIPVFPMDGGQAAYGILQYVTKPRTALLISIWSSMVIGGLLLALGLLTKQIFLAVIVGFLLFQNYQRLQMLKK